MPSRAPPRPGVASPFIFGPLLASPLPWPSWHLKGNPGQGRQVVEVVKPKRGRPPKPRPAAQPAQEGLATAQQEGPRRARGTPLSTCLDPQIATT